MHADTLGYSSLFKQLTPECSVQILAKVYAHHSKKLEPEATRGSRADLSR